MDNYTIAPTLILLSTVFAILWILYLFFEITIEPWISGSVISFITLLGMTITRKAITYKYPPANSTV